MFSPATEPHGFRQASRPAPNSQSAVANEKRGCDARASFFRFNLRPVSGRNGRGGCAAVFGGDEVAGGGAAEVAGALGICDLRMTINERVRFALTMTGWARNSLLPAHSFIRSSVSLILRPEDFGRQPMLLAFCPRVWISMLSQNHPEW